MQLNKKTKIRILLNKKPTDGKQVFSQFLRSRKVLSMERKEVFSVAVVL